MKKKHREGLTALCFLAPNLIGFLIFTAIPVVMSFVMSLYDWPVVGERRFVGFDNYKNLFTADPLFGKVMGNTVFYVAAYAVLNILIAMLLAVWLTSKIKNLKFYRAGSD